MRIAIVVRSLKIGGMERIAVNLSEAFAKYGYESHLIYFKNKDKAFTPNNDVYLHHYDLEKSLKLTVIGLFLHIFAKWFNILFRRTYYFWQGIFLSPIFKYKILKTEKKYGKFDLIIMRGHGTFENTWPLKDKRIVQMIESVLIPYGSRQRNFYLKCLYTNKNLACVSSGVKEKLEKILKITKINVNSLNVITNPLNTDAIRQQSLEYKPDIKLPYIVTVSRLDANKNLTFLLKSYAYARRELDLLHPLIIIGDGAQHQKLKKEAIELNIINHIHFLGLLKNPFPWVKDADLFVFSSLSEGLGYVLLESLACHTKVISTNGEGGIKDVMKNELSQYLVEFNEVKFANKIVQELNVNNTLNYTKAIEDFEPKKIVDRYIQLYAK